MKVKQDKIESEDENIYENFESRRRPDVVKVEKDIYCTAGDQHAESSTLSPTVVRSYGAVAVCMGLLCVLLLAGIVGLGLQYHMAVVENKGREQEQMTKVINENINLVKNLTELNDELQTVKKRICPQGWHYFNNRCYYLSATVKTWVEAREDCKNKGADLVIINSREEQDFVHNLNQLFWIGLTDSEVEGEWKWLDGSPLSKNYTYWRAGEPNDFKKSEDCAEQQNSAAEDGWNDVACDSEFNQRNWVCEKSNVS